MSRFFVALALALACAVVLFPSGASAGTCSSDLTCQFLECRSPASGVPSLLWGDLQPTDTGQLPANRDNTSFNISFGVPSSSEPLWMSVDLENGWLFAGINAGLEIWDARGALATNPSRASSIGSGSFLSWIADPHETNPVRDVDAPPGNDAVLAVAVEGDGGLNVFNTSNKANPRGLYADSGKSFNAVYAAHIGGRDYAFGASPGGGLLAYDLSSASSLATGCVEDTPSSTSCGVYEGRLGSRNVVLWVDGVDDFVVASGGATGERGVEIWNVADPADPVLELSALGSELLHGVALWERDGSYYLATRVQVTGATQGRIYDVSCLATSSCSSLGSPLWTLSLPSGATFYYVTYSASGGRDFLYFGVSDRCSQALQNEWLFDVSAPAQTFDVTPPPRLYNGQMTGYWGWYYRRNPTGFNNVAPRIGKFNNQYFYRAAYAVLDIHELTTCTPTADFTWSPMPVYEGEPVDFVDQSLCSPSSWSWSFANATPSSSSATNPSGVVFDLTGNQPVTLTVSSGLGSDMTTKMVPVQQAEPAIASVTASPVDPLVCQPITFTAQGVTGLPPLGFSWEVTDSGGGTVATGGDVNPFTWDSTGATPGVYTATVTVTNSAGSAFADSPNVNLGALPALAITSPGGLPETLNGPPFSGPTVDFLIQAVGATEWRWDFGDGTPPVWTSNPQDGPMPSHTYAVASTYDVSVEVRNCVEGPLSSGVLPVEITATGPLVADFAAQGLVCNSLGCFADQGVSITFTDLSQGDPQLWDYDWNGDGQYENDANDQPVGSHTFYQAGTFTPVLKVHRGTEEDSYFHDTIFVGANPNPYIQLNAPFKAPALPAVSMSASAVNCVPAPTSWSWNVGTGGTIVGSSTGATVSVTYDAPGQRTVEVTAVGGACSGSTAVHVLNVTPPLEVVFTDGFESGDTSAWTAVVP